MGLFLLVVPSHLMFIPICVLIFSMIPSNEANPDQSNAVIVYNKNRPLLGLISHQLKRNFKEAKKRVTPRGASDIIVIRNPIDGTLSASPLLVHFGNGLFPAGTTRRRIAEKRVEMIVNGTIIRGMDLRIRPNGRVEPQALKLTVLEGILLEGSNRTRRRIHSVRFLVKDWKGRRVKLRCFLHYWNDTAKLVISDIDGTVTKSDMLGMVLKDAWIQPDVRTLYSGIIKNGYKLVYLSARPASTGMLTRKFLKQLQLPEGPLLLSPEPFGKALKTAVTDPGRVKVRCLLSLKELFNQPVTRTYRPKVKSTMNKVQYAGHNPFHAAFGNQETDQFAYEMASIPFIFTIDQTGQVIVGKAGRNSEGKSYRHLIEHLNEYFPSIH